MQLDSPTLIHTISMRIESICLLAFSLFIIVGCQQDAPIPPTSTAATSEEAVLNNANLPGVLSSGIEAHGGLTLWQSMGSLEYTITRGERTEHHLTALGSRQTIQSGEGYRLGYDGENVWVEPSVDSFTGDPKFYRGLDFYFFAIPFVLADPGTIHEDLGTVMIDGAPYNAVKVSYEAGVGDSPNDYYIVHFDPETNQLAYLLYTVTYRSGEPNENFSLRAYEEWQEVNGLLLPQKIASYQWDSETRQSGEKRGESLFSSVSVLPEIPDTSIFAKPESAEYFSMQ